MTIKDFLQNYVSLRGIEMLKEYRRLYNGHSFDAWKVMPVEYFDRGFPWSDTPFSDEFRVVQTRIGRGEFVDAGEVINRASRHHRLVSTANGKNAKVFVDNFLTPLAASWVVANHRVDCLVTDWAWADGTTMYHLMNGRYLDAAYHINHMVLLLTNPPTSQEPKYIIPEIDLPHPEAEPEAEEHANHRCRAVGGDDLESVLIALSKHVGLSRNDKTIEKTVKQFLRRRS
jgi:hypothetical protein